MFVCFDAQTNAARTLVVRGHMWWLSGVLLPNLGLQMVSIELVSVQLVSADLVSADLVSAVVSKAKRCQPHMLNCLCCVSVGCQLL